MAAGIINLQKASGGITKISSADGTGVTELTVPESGNLVSVDTTVTDNAIARYDGTTGKLQNSGVTIDDSGNVGIGTNSPTFNLVIRNTQTIGTPTDNAILQLKSSNRNSGILLDTVGASYAGSITNSINGTAISQLRFDSIGNILSILPNGGIGYGAGAGGTVTQLTSKGTSVTLNKPCGRIIMNNSSLAAGATAVFQVNNNLVTTTDNISVIAIDNASYEVTLGWNTTGAFVIRVKNVTAGALSEPLNIQFLVCKGATV